MRTKEELLAALSNYGQPDYQHTAAKAELDILMAQEYVEILEKTRETVYEVLAAMSSGIMGFRDVVDRAAEDGSITSRLLVRWTKVLALTTSGLMLATFALVCATIRASH